MGPLRALAAAATLLAATAMASAQQPTSEQAAEWEKVIAAAKAEGTVTLYSGHVGVTFHSDIAKSFEKKYEIRSPGPGGARERAAGAHPHRADH